jgi:type VI secretion system protein ImpA
MTNIQPFLEPISPETPCGKDISYDQAFLNLESLVKGKEETQFSAAEEANWREVQPAVLELMGQSKNLRLAIIASMAMIENEGLEGFRNGMLVLKTWVDQYWDALYPLLDPEDNNDPTQRVNLLQALSSQGATQEKFLDRLTSATLAESPSLGRYSLKAIESGKTQQEIEAAFRDTDAAVLRARFDAAAQALALVKEMDSVLAAKIGRGTSPNFGDLIGTLNQLTATMGPFCGVAVAAEAGGGAAPGVAGAKAAGGGLASINSRDDVVRALEAICNYYKTNEPASPIPLLLERARRLVDKDFMTIIGDLAPNAVSQFELLAAKPPGA